MGKHGKTSTSQPTGKELSETGMPQSIPTASSDSGSGEDVHKDAVKPDTDPNNTEKALKQIEDEERQEHHKDPPDDPSDLEKSDIEDDDDDQPEVKDDDDDKPKVKDDDDDKPEDEDEDDDKPEDEYEDDDKPKVKDDDDDKPKVEDEDDDKPKVEVEDGDKPKVKDEDDDKPKVKDEDDDKPEDEDDDDDKPKVKDDDDDKPKVKDDDDDKSEVEDEDEDDDKPKVKDEDDDDLVDDDLDDDDYDDDDDVEDAEEEEEEEGDSSSAAQRRGHALPRSRRRGKASVIAGQSRSSSQSGPALPPVPDPEYLNRLQNDSDDIKRRKVIKERLITERENDSKRLFAKTRDVSVRRGGAIGGDGLDKFGKYAGYAGLAVNGLSAAITGAGLGLTAAGAAGSEEAKKSGDLMLHGDKDNNDYSWPDATNIISAVGNGLGVIGSTSRTLAQLHKAVQGRNKYKKKAARIRATGHFFGLVGSGTALASNLNNCGVFGDRAIDEKANTRETGGWLDLASGLASLIKPFADVGADAAERNDHGLVKTAADSIWGNGDPNKQRINKQAIIASKRALKNAMDSGNRHDIADARKARNTAKANYYAMQQAAMMHEVHTHDSVGKKNAANIIGALAGGIGAISNSLNKFGFGSGWGIAGGVAGVIGTSAKLLGAGISESEAENVRTRVKGKKREIVNAYLNEKKNSIKKQFLNMRFSNGEMGALGNSGKTLSDDEAKIVAVIRLGIDVPNDSDSIAPSMIDEAFEKLTEKRAKNILRSDDASRNRILIALGFDNPDNATLEDVISALSGE